LTAVQHPVTTVLRPAPVPPPVTRPAPGRYRLDADRCIAEFTVRHLLVAAARGRMRAHEGELWIDDVDPRDSWVRVDFDTRTLVTHNRERDRALLGPELLDAERCPVARFESFDVIAIGDGRLSVTGDLYAGHASTEVVLDARVVHTDDDRVRFAATGAVSRRSLGLQWGPLEEVGVLIADTVTIIAAAEFVR
jgi:polyisoprenoid-binding protein YceI